MNPNATQKLEDFLPVEFKDKFLLRRALTHRSYLNENREALEDNERLEFVGDAILAFVVAEWLYKQYPEKREGFLTKIRSSLVHTQKLAEFARKIGLGQALLLGKGEEQAGGRDRAPILCDAFEALIAAVYLDGGMEAVKQLVLPLVAEEADKIIFNRSDEDVKSRLQEWAQAQGFGSPHYELVGESGPDHAKNFKVAVWVNETRLGEGSGVSKQSAEKSAAADALITLEIRDL